MTAVALAPPDAFDWCIACDERPAHDNSLLCWECDESLPFTVGDFLAQGVDQALGVALTRIVEVGWAA